jgi:regulator of replication initiation timing
MKGGLSLAKGEAGCGCARAGVGRNPFVHQTAYYAMPAGRFQVAAAALALLLLPALVSAQTPTPLVLNLDRDLKIIVTYPLEVKYGSTVRVLFDITAMDNVTVNRMWVRFVLVHEGGAVILYDQAVIENKVLPAGYQVQFVISFQAAVPQPRPPVEPFLELYMTVEYVADNKTKFFEYKSAPILVPRATYEELSSALAVAQQKAALADQLAQRVRELELKLANESGKCVVLSEQLRNLNTEWSALKEKVGGLQAENSALRARVAELESENLKLQQELASLREERGSLSSKLSSTQDVYSATLAELNNLRSRYENLSAEAGTLKVALAVTASAAAVLAVALALFLAKRRNTPPIPPPPPPTQQLPATRPPAQPQADPGDPAFDDPPPPPTIPVGYVLTVPD